ncbi:MAG: c-type cytochrome [Planctomycetales bacterium]|nr:c-type cytochrome [Planctomycetales bacterium]
MIGWCQDGNLLQVTPPAQQTASENSLPSLDGPIRIAKLLWNANSRSAANTLEKTLETSLSRGMLKDLQQALSTLKPLADTIVDAGNFDDPRFASSVAVSLLLNDNHQADEIAAMLEKVGDLGRRQLVLQTWYAISPASAAKYLQRTLSQAKLVDEQWTAHMVTTAFSYSSGETTESVLAAWEDLPQAVRIAAIEPMTNTLRTMRSLVEAVGSGKVDRNLVNTNQLRKWSDHSDKELSGRIQQIWGRVRVEGDKAREQVVAQTLKQILSGATGSASRGEAVFERVCSQCHRFRDKGFEVGPDITNNGRGNLQQLVSNMLDPSLVIGEAFQARTVLTSDGEVVSGLVVADSEKYLKLKVQGGKTVEFDKQDDIEETKLSDRSLMPEGLEGQGDTQQLLDLIAYLCLVHPLDAAENELIPGTPMHFVQP